MSAIASGMGARLTGMTARGFGRLLRKELRGQENLFPLLLGLTVLWDLFLATRRGAWGPEIVGGLSLIPLGLLPFWSLWAGFQSVRSEWSGDHAQMLLAFPVPYWQVQATKLLAIWLQVLAVAVVAGGASLVYFGPLVQRGMQELWQHLRFADLVQVGLLCGLVVVHLSVFGQFVSAAWRSVARYGALVALWATVLVGWASGRISGLLGYLFRWVPDLTLVGVSVSSDAMRTQVVRQPVILDSAPLLGSVLFAAILFAVGALLLERAADV
ncbi:hypothetical protein [Limnochorda pilosa]|uniref:Uncharacterized protein n=1 Tax=Limnochorda pilosa TaxID=1555112 RepID=A0A0K2SG92_LIMPI|nr:hypothetical protein [Limnochorda pilosa]BAS26110.1 hypothetical protein LIP_0253 [Limnochorda pilosa]